MIRSDRERYSYEPFTRHGFYRQVNRALVERTVAALTPPVGRPVTVVDLSCGTGAVTEMIIEALAERGVDAGVVAVEPDVDALAGARSRLAGAPLDVRFVEGDASALRELPGQTDVVFLCNAIHLVEDKDGTVARIADTLVPGGLLAFNSAFFTGAYVPGTENFYRLWTIRAMRWLRAERPDVRLDRSAKAQAMRWLSPEEYEALLADNGFALVERSLDEAIMTLPSFQDIGRYWLFIEGALPGAPLDAGAEALHHGAAQAFEHQGLSVGVPRNWLQVLARRTGA
jgi:Methylase involved in ubiquinone/menaquinone biosynthesis